MTQQPTKPDNDDSVRRRSARRTAIWLALVAVGVYVLFLLVGVLGQ